MKRFVNGIEQEPIWQKRVPQKIPDWLQTATVSFPSGRTAEELCATTPPTSCGPSTSASSTSTRGRRGAATSTTPTSCASTSTRRPGWRGTTCARSRWSRARRARRARAARLPEDERARKGIHVNVRIAPRVDVHRGAPGGAGAGARGRAAHAAGHEQVVEGGAPRRVRRLQPERARPHRGLAPTRCARRRTPASRARWTGTRWPTSTRASCAWTPCPTRLAEVGDPAADIDAHAGSLDALHALADRDEAEGLGDAPWPPHFAKQRGEPKRVQPSARPRPAQAHAAGPRRRSAAGRAARPAVPAPARAGQAPPAAHGPGLRGGVRRRLAVELVDACSPWGPCPGASA